MRIAVISDTHSRLATIAAVMAKIRARGVECILHCGDIEDTEAIPLFAGTPIHFVLGNCDGDANGIKDAIAEGGAFFHEYFGNLELGGRKIAWLHGHDRRLLRDVENSGHYDFLFYGHSHQAEQHRTGSTLVVNPDALHRARPKSFVYLDLATGALESVRLE